MKGMPRSSIIADGGQSGKGDRDGDRYPRPTKHRPGKASAYTVWLRVLLKRHRKRWKDRPLCVVLYCRESPGSPSAHGKVKRQERILLRKLKRLGIRVLEVFRDASTSGWFDPVFNPEAWKANRAILVEAADYARAHTPPGQQPIVVAKDVPRFVRAFGYRPELINTPRGLPTDRDFHHLLALCPGVTLATLQHPDAPLREVRSVETKDGMRESGHLGGRPATGPTRRHRPEGGWPDFREKHLPLARRLRERGYPYAWVAYHISFLAMKRGERRTPLSENTISKWLRYYGQD
jgi:hypothetical protein